MSSLPDWCRDEWREQGSNPIFPRLDFHPSHGTTLSPQLPPPMASWRQVLGFFSIWRLLQSTSVKKTTTLFLLPLFFQVRGSERKETITQGWNRQSCPACMRERGSDPAMDTQKHNIPGNSWEWPKKKWHPHQLQRHQKYVQRVNKSFQVGTPRDSHNLRSSDPQRFTSWVVSGSRGGALFFIELWCHRCSNL